MRQLPEQKKRFRIVYTTSEYDKETKKFYTDYNIESETDDIEEVGSLLQKTFDNTHFKIYYTRCAFFTDEYYLWFDYGSHSCFVELHFLDDKAQSEYLARMNKESKHEA